jgi:hypothetical protein
VLDTKDEDLPILVWQYAAAVDLDCHHEWNSFWVVELLNYEVGNGGFVQYFWNNKGDYVDDTLAALAEMKASKHLALFREAIARWHRELAANPRLWGPEDGMSQALYSSSSLPALDDRWYAPPIEPIEAAYIRAHITAFTAY